MSDAAATTTPIAVLAKGERLVPPLPANQCAVRRLEADLWTGLLQGLGLQTINNVFGRPATIQLELALGELLGRTVLPDRPEIAQYLERTLHACAAANAELRFFALSPHPESRYLRNAARELARAIGTLKQCGPMAGNAVCLLYHVQLHVAAAKTLTLAEQPALALLQRIQRALNWHDSTVRTWREWSDHRFGPIRCVEWSPDGRFCKALGYGYDGLDYPIKRAGERTHHQERAWRELEDASLRPLVRSGLVWRAVEWELLGHG